MPHGSSSRSRQTKATESLSTATIIQRVNTQGGGLSGNCDKAGDLKSVAYTTDYIFLKK